MKRRKLMYCLTLTAGFLATGGLAAMTPGGKQTFTLNRMEAKLLTTFTKQVATYPAITPALWRQLTEPVKLLNRRPEGFTFVNASGQTVDLSLKNGHLRAATL